MLQKMWARLAFTHDDTSKTPIYIVVIEGLKFDECLTSLVEVSALSQDAIAKQPTLILPLVSLIG